MQLVPFFMKRLGLLSLPVFLSLLAGCAPSEPRAWDTIGAKAVCGSRIKSLLRDPDSYEFESATITETSGEYNEFGKAYIIYRAKNGFGGYTRGGAECERYDNYGEVYIKARLLEN